MTSFVRKSPARLACTIALLASTSVGAQILPASDMHGKKALFVVGGADPHRASDDPLVKKHLEKMGFAVTQVTDDEPASKASGQDLVVISSTANAHVFQDHYKELAVPVFTWNARGFSTMNMTGPKEHEDFEILTPDLFPQRVFSQMYGYITSPTWPIAKELGLKSQLYGPVYLRANNTIWGRPSVGGTIVSNLEGDPSRAGIFTYEKSASMYGGFVAPARRVGFYMYDDTFHELTAAYGPAAKDPYVSAWNVGLKLFDTSIRWAVSPPAQTESLGPAGLHAKLAAAAKGKKLLFVRRTNAIEGLDADEHMIDYFTKLGFDLKLADQSDIPPSDAGIDLTVLSATNSKWKTANKYRDTKTPMICLDGLFADMYKMSGRRRFTEYGEHGEKQLQDPTENYLNIVSAWHPMAAGMKPGVVKFVKEPAMIKWATPTPGATIIAALPNADQQDAIFSYEKGATMADEYVAPARRVMFPLDNEAFDELTEDGLALFDAAMLWALENPPS